MAVEEKDKKKTPKKTRTLVSFVIDRSGSMATLTSDSIGGFNSYVKGLLKEQGDDEVLLTLTVFDDMIDTLYTNKPLKDVPELTENQAYARGSTALYDAVGRAISSIEKDVKKKDKAIIVITTDGYENASKEYNAKQIKDWIDTLDAKPNFTFIYMAANQDAMTVGSTMGFHTGNTMSYAASSAGGQSMYQTVTDTSNKLRSSQGQKTNSAFRDAGFDNTKVLGDESGDTEKSS